MSQTDVFDVLFDVTPSRRAIANALKPFVVIEKPDMNIVTLEAFDELNPLQMLLVCLLAWHVLMERGHVNKPPSLADIMAIMGDDEKTNRGILATLEHEGFVESRYAIRQDALTRAVRSLSKESEAE